jgi:two-component system, chemotaxis family, protein-glutamate methylesterase/glutaminase
LVKIMTENLKILIIDDDAKSLEGIKDTVETIAGVVVSDVVKSNRMAVARLKYQPVDIVLLSIHMSDGKSLDTMREIKHSAPNTEVVIMSPSDNKDAKVAILALELGALEHLKKPSGKFSSNDQREFRLRLMTIMGLVQNRKNVRRSKVDKKNPTAVLVKTPASDKPTGGITKRGTAGIFTPAKAALKTPTFLFGIDVVAIAVSTGGPNALAQVIPKLPGDLGVPILLVQHMPATLTASLAESLNTQSALTVREAIHGEEVLPNVVYIAPGGKHMVVNRLPAPVQSVEKKIVELNEDPPQNSVRPSADVLFHSVAQVYGGNMLAVVMTGMGNDGLKGVKTMKAMSCYCLTQSEDTCVVYGMPRAVDEASLSDEKVPLEKLADSITKVIRKKR